MLPFQGALDAFLGIFSLVPQPVRSFVSVALALFLIGALIRLVVAHL